MLNRIVFSLCVLIKNDAFTLPILKNRMLFSNMELTELYSENQSYNEMSFDDIKVMKCDVIMDLRILDDWDYCLNILDLQSLSWSNYDNNDEDDDGYLDYYFPDIIFPKS